MGKLSHAIKAGQKAAQLATHAKNAHAAATTIHAATATPTSRREMGRSAGRYVLREGASTGKAAGQAWLRPFELIPRLACRLLQLLLALVAVGFYSHHYNRHYRHHNHDHDTDVESDVAKTMAPVAVVVAAVIVAGVAAVSAVVFAVLSAAAAVPLPLVGRRFALLKTHRAFAWDASVFVAWLVVFAVFAGIFLPKRTSGEDSRGGGGGNGVGPMKTAVWVDLANALLWLVSAAYGCFKTCLGRRVDAAGDRIGDRMFVRRDGGGVEDGHEMKKFPESV